MNRPTSTFAICLIAMLFAALAFAQDKATPAAPPAGAKSDAVDERDAKTLINNDRVRVTETRYKPGASSGMSERPPRVVRALTDGTLEKTWADGRKETIHLKAGDVRFSPKETYTQRNVGTTDVVLFTVNLR